MKKREWKFGIISSGVAVVLLLCGPAFAELKLNTEDQTMLSRSYIEMNRKTMVAINLDLTEEESKVFWPVYESARE